MKTLYIECNMGAAGDMLMSALLELHPDPDGFMERLNRLGIPGVTIEKRTAVKCGITGTHVEVSVNGVHEDEHMHEHHHDHHHHDHEHSREHDHEHDHHHEHDHGHHHAHSHSHTGMHEIEHIISHFDLPDKIKNDIFAVYHLIAEAESHAHNRPIDQIHFHEVGTMDAVADITGVCMLMNELAPDKIITSPVHVGSGKVRCAHGILPVPAPATAYILKDVPIYGGAVQGELCTPTGAALLKHFADEFGNMPVMKVQKTGYGMGTKDFETANCLRVMLGETAETPDSVLELCCNIDDMTAEEIGFASERILAAGALEVFTIPVGMKKNRPGTLLSCLCRPEDKEEMIGTIFRCTSTIGIREHVCGRYVLSRTEDAVETPYGSVRVKRSEGYGVKRIKTEYDDIVRIAEEKNISINEARRLVEIE